MIDAGEYPNRLIGQRILPPSETMGRKVVAVNLAESPLGWLARRGLLTDRQVAAGELLREEHARAGLGVRVTMRWEAGVYGRGDGGVGAHGQALAAIDAKRRFDAAMEAVGEGLSDILWRVACEGEGLAEAEKGLGWPTRAGKLVLGIALDRLVKYYENQYGSF